MLQAHSLLWNYLWIAPNLFLLALAVVIALRNFSRQIPAFLAFAVLAAVGDLAVYSADISPAISPENFWRIDWVNLLLEALLKFIVIGEVFSRLCASYQAISRVGRLFISGVGASLVLVASVVAAFGRGDSTRTLISGAHLLEQTVFIVECGLVLFLFLFAAHFHLWWDNLSFGILLGFAISSCEHLAAWAVIANASPSDQTRVFFDFLDMATFHLCVLIWFYYVLAPRKIVAKSSVPLPDNNLALWNRELERLLQK